MINKLNRYLLMVASVLFLAGGPAFGYDPFLTEMNSTYGTNFSCNVCHPYTANYGADFLSAYTANGGSSAMAFQSIESLDSDGDSYINGDELSSGTNPSDAASFPDPATDTTPPTVTITSPAATEYLCNVLPLQYSTSDGAVEVFIDGLQSTQFPGSILAGLTNGDHTLRIQSTDAAGNIGSSEVIFTVNANLLTTVPDMNGSNADELAVLDVSAEGKSKTVLKDPASRAQVGIVNFPKYFAPVAMAGIPDLDGNSTAELAVLGVDVNGYIKVLVKDAASSSLINTVLFPVDFAPVSFVVVPDMNGNGAPELAVLGVDVAGNVKVNIKDSVDRSLVKVVNFPPSISPAALAVVPDMNGNGSSELALLGVDADGTIKVKVKDSATRTMINTVLFPSSLTPVSLAVVADMNGNGSPELAVLGVNGEGKNKVIVKDATSRALVSAVNIPSSVTPSSLAVVADMNGNGSPELAVLGVDAAGTVSVKLKDASNHTSFNHVIFYSTIEKPNGETIYTAQCAGCHSINGYDATGSPDLASTGDLIGAKFATNHNGITLSGAEQTAVAGFLDQYTAPPAGGSCTSCHGQPPSGSISPNVQGAHLVHSNLPNVGTDCSSCHGTANHNGTVDQNISTVFNSKGATGVANADKTCSNVSCHGGQTTPNWVTGSLNVNTDCRSCHTLGTSDFNSYNSGEHGKSVHVNRACTDCHNVTTLATNHFSSLNTSALEGPASATVGGGSTRVSNYNASTGNCTTICHGDKRW